MQILNIAGYKFVTLSDLPGLRSKLLEQCRLLQLKGTILLSVEGINVTLAGTCRFIEIFKNFLKDYSFFKDLSFRESYSACQPFKRMKVKIKKEIITMRCREIQPEQQTAQHLSPEELKQWLDEKRAITLLDTRNGYEIEFGTFTDAMHFDLDDFSEFPKASEKLTRDKPIVMFCTGGIRCEKAGAYLLQAGFSEIYQLDGGILNYFAKIGSAHYQGECFVFDERVALNFELQAKV
jgi:UPF0176 protein